MGSTPTRSMDVCVSSFCVCVALCVRVGSGLATGRSHVQGVLLTVYRIGTEKKKRPRPNKRPVEPLITVTIIIILKVQCTKFSGVGLFRYAFQFSVSRRCFRKNCVRLSHRNCTTINRVATYTHLRHRKY